MHRSPFAILSIASLYLFACQAPAPYKLIGEAQGTTYAITYYGAEAQNYQAQADSIFEAINQSLSTYHPGSTILAFNERARLESDDAHFFNMLEQSRSIYELTEGAFDPTVMPLVKAWGFGPEEAPEPRTDNLDSLMALVGFDQLRYAQAEEGETYLVEKSQPHVQLDFNAIAQGYTVDVLAQFLEDQGLTNYLVELGGEVRAKGKNPKGESWTLGIEKPNEIIGIRDLAAVLSVTDRSVATSGSYRKFYLKDGIRYSHTINPATGKPVQHSLLSVTVLTDGAAKADAFATAFMVWGRERSMDFMAARPELALEAYFIVDEEGALTFYATEGLEGIMEQVEETSLEP